MKKLSVSPNARFKFSDIKTNVIDVTPVTIGRHTMLRPYQMKLNSMLFFVIVVTIARSGLQLLAFECYAIVKLYKEEHLVSWLIGWAKTLMNKATSWTHHRAISAAAFHIEILYDVVVMFDTRTFSSEKLQLTCNMVNTFGYCSIICNPLSMVSRIVSLPYFVIGCFKA